MGGFLQKQNSRFSAEKRALNSIMSLVPLVMGDGRGSQMQSHRQRICSSWRKLLAVWPGGYDIDTSLSTVKGLWTVCQYIVSNELLILF